jgi:hypothetical protein
MATIPKNIRAQRVQELLSYVLKSEVGSEIWNMYENELAHELFELFESKPSVESIISYYTLHIVDMCMEIIKSPQGRFQDVTMINCWAILNRSFGVGDSSETAEYLQMGIDCGLLELSVREMSYFSPFRCGGRAVSWCSGIINKAASIQRLSRRVVEIGAPILCLNIIQESKSLTNVDDIGILAESVKILAWLGRTQVESVRTLPDIVKHMNHLVSTLLTSDEEHLQYIGFVAAKTIIRVYGTSENCSQFIHQNHAVLQYYVQYFDDILKNGPKATYSGQVLDLYIVSSAEKMNKSLFLPLISRVVEMTSGYGKDDFELMRFGIMFLVQISDNDICREEMKSNNIPNNNKEKIQRMIQIVECGRHYDKEMFGFLSMLKGVVG